MDSAQDAESLLPLTQTMLHIMPARIDGETHGYGMVPDATVRMLQIGML
jgi:hypothetical protein